MEFLEDQRGDRKSCLPPFTGKLGTERRKERQKKEEKEREEKERKERLTRFQTAGEDFFLVCISNMYHEKYLHGCF